MKASFENPLPHPRNYAFVVRVQHHRFWYLPGPGWAVIAGALAAWPFPFSASFVVFTLLLWVLFDPLLGTISTLSYSYDAWRVKPPGEVPPWLRVGLPYLIPDSPAYRFSLFLTQIFTSPSGEGFTLVITIPLAILLAVYLGIPVLAYVILCLLVIFFAPRTPAQRWLYCLMEFLIPYLLVVDSLSTLTLATILVGLIFGCMYYAILQFNQGDYRGQRLLLLGLSTAAIFLFGLHKPFWAVPVVLTLFFCQLLYVPLMENSDSAQASSLYLKRIAIPLLSSILVTALAVGGG